MALGPDGEFLYLSDYRNGVMTVISTALMKPYTEGVNELRTRGRDCWDYQPVKRAPVEFRVPGRQRISLIGRALSSRWHLVYPLVCRRWCDGPSSCRQRAALIGR